MEYRHVAYNTETGEILMSNTSKWLNEKVKATGYTGWIFSHHGWETLRKKL